jgi:hypothetical protein
VIDFVTDVYDRVDRRHEANEAARRKKDGYHEAIAAIQRAKGQHTRLGRDMRDFAIGKYVGVPDEDHPWRIDPDLLQYLARMPGRGAFQNQSKPGQEVPWPGSLQDLESRLEPSSTPA